MSASVHDLNLNHWIVTTTPDGSTEYTCKVCLNYSSSQLRRCIAHARTKLHQDSVAVAEIEQGELGPPSVSQAPYPVGSGERVLDDGVRYVISSMYSNVPTNPPLPPYPPNQPSEASTLHPRSDHWETNTSDVSQVTGIPWGVHGDDFIVEEPELQDLLSNVLDTAMHILDLNLSDDEWAERSEEEIDSEADFSGDELLGFEDSGSDEDGDVPRKRARGQTSDPQTARLWFPWQDRLTCTLDLLMHLPRSVFSQRQLELFLWLLRVNGVDDVPSTNTIKRLNVSLQKICGITSVEYKGILGNRYFVNNLSQILAQEMANPLVRRHLKFYPEDAGKHVSQATHGARWLEELSPDDSTPMIRRGTTDFYLQEPTMLVDRSVCMPFRWFQRGGKMWAKAWVMDIYTEYDIEGYRHRYWRIREDMPVKEVMENLLWKNFPTLQEQFRELDVPKPHVIHHTCRLREDRTIERLVWDSETRVGNRWRALAAGRRVVALPMWLYCDDTSGNVSKRWNEHNSYIFTLAGLPTDQVTKEYNLHFLCTSNIAPPLEMLDGVVSQIEMAREKGVWAWDCVHNELVLVFPSVLALLGDNPMQSELACHIGMGGKYFCRVCWVHGTDPKPTGTSGGSNQNTTTADSRPASPMPTGSPLPEHTPLPPPPILPTGLPSVHSSRPPTPGTVPPSTISQSTPESQPAVETMNSMVDRIKRFIKGGHPRTRHETEAYLKEYMDWAQKIGNLKNISDKKTATGVKDTLQDFFLDKLHKAYQSVSGNTARQEALNAAVHSLPRTTTSPIWRIQGLDPHQDTPVEILHVVLLGIVKYFWRDLVHNQLEKKDKEKDLLIHRLSSLDVSGLGISPLRGRTLVQYAGSLTGGDFRAIAQVAPFVIYDLVGQDCYETWVAISKLVPKIWQREIDDIDLYLEALKDEIEQFLLRTAKWTSQWFNKPKFHVLRHLPEHIRRFGPAILFATESFESFNAVIRAKSVHSNRQAPSRDIAAAFAQGNRVRHLLSGGRFFKPSVVDPKPADEYSLDERSDSANWTTAGQNVRQLVSPHSGMGSTISSYLGLPFSVNQRSTGFCISDKSPSRPFARTLAGQAFTLHGDQRLVKTFVSVVLPSADVARLGQHVLYTAPMADGGLPSWNVGIVKEILQFEGTSGERERSPDYLLLQTVNVAGPAPKYEMPALVVTNQYSLIEFKNVKCTVNVQHNCHSNNCGPTGTQIVHQERRDTTLTVPIIEHSNAPQDLVLNLCQMRNASEISNFDVRPARLAFEETILQSARHEVDRRKAKSSIVPLSRGTSNRGGRGGSLAGRGRSLGGRGGSSAGLNSTRRPVTPQLPALAPSVETPISFRFVTADGHPF